MKVGVHGLTVHRNQKPLYSNVSLTFGENLYHAVIGKNGSGKTTFLRVLLGMVMPAEGHITIDGKVRQEIDDRRISVIHQYDSLSDYLSVRQFVKLEQIYAQADKSYAGYLLDRLELRQWTGRRIGTLSLGTRRKLSIWKALLKNPELMIMDEPTNGLDEAVKAQVWDMLLELKQKGMTAIIATNNKDEALTLCDRFYKVADGQIRETEFRRGENNVK